LPAAAAKKSIFVEKPLGIAGEESREMAAAIEKNNLIFTTGYTSRTTPVNLFLNLFLKEQIEKGVFGKITHVRGSTSHAGSLTGIFDGEFRWMADLKQAGVGGFGDLGTHSLDILMWMFGDVDSITADIKVVTGRYGDCDETGEALIKFKSGVTGTLNAGWVDLGNAASLEVSGTEAYAAVINGQLFFKCAKVEGADGSQPWTKLPEALPVPMAQFVEAINGKSVKTLVPAHDAAARVVVMEAAYKASKDHAWVKLA
jgi:predicted dehydrogenase